MWTALAFSANANLRQCCILQRADPRFVRLRWEWCGAALRARSIGNECRGHLPLPCFTLPINLAPVPAALFHTPFHAHPAALFPLAPWIAHLPLVQPYDVLYVRKQAVGQVVRKHQLLAGAAGQGGAGRGRAGSQEGKQARQSRREAGQAGRWDNNRVQSISINCHEEARQAGGAQKCCPNASAPAQEAQGAQLQGHVCNAECARPPSKGTLCTGVLCPTPHLKLGTGGSPPSSTSSLLRHLLLQPGNGEHSREMGSTQGQRMA